MRTIIIVLFFLTGFLAKSQSIFRWGIVGGINASKIIADTKTKSLNGYHGGVIAEIKTPNGIGFEADALLSSKGTVVESLNSNLQKTNSDYKLTYLDFPIVVKKYFLTVFNVQAGPQFSFLLNANLDNKDMKPNLNSFDLAAVAGLELDAKVAKASIRYNYGITNVGNKIGHNSVLQITIGIWVK